MATALCAIAQLTTCALDCADTSDFMRRREIAVGDFCRQRAEGFPCLGPFNGGVTSFPVYAPLLFSSWDAMLGGDFGIVPAFFGQAAEGEGECQNSYSYSIYLTLPTAALFWIQCWKHHNPGLGVAWSQDVGNDVVFAFGGLSNIQAVSNPEFRAEIPTGRF